MTANDHDLLRQFTREQSQEAFTALVNRHLNLVYSAALRQVRSPQLAEEVSQFVFTQLACHAPKLNSDTILTAWLYQVTRHAAVDAVRREARRQAREQIACQMSDMNQAATDWAHIEPMLDEAMQSLDEADRLAVLLRYFENKTLREVGEALGASEDAAQKRVSRAVERLRQFFSKRKVTVGTAGFVALLSANAVQAAPSGLAAVVAAGAPAAVATLSASTAIAITKTIAMTTLQKTIIATVAAVAVAVGLYQARQISTLRGQVQTLEQQQVQIAALSNQVQELERQRDAAVNKLAALPGELATSKKSPNEVLRLRGEVGRLQREKTDLGATSPLSKMTAKPETREMVRGQQKQVMGMIYSGFAAQLKLTPEQTEKLNNLLADHVMDNLDHVQAMLRDKLGPDQVTQALAAQDAAVQEKIQDLLGPNSVAQYQDYTKNLLSTMTAYLFSGMTTGTAEEKAEKYRQLSQVMQEEVQAALASAGLPANYQVVPSLNFRNFASEAEGDQSLNLLEDIYQRVGARAGSFLSADEVAKLQEFKASTIAYHRNTLTLGRTMMAPIAN